MKCTIVRNLIMLFNRLFFKPIKNDTCSNPFRKKQLYSPKT